MFKYVFKKYISITLMPAVIFLLMAGCGGGGSGSSSGGQINGQDVNLSSLLVSEGILSPSFKPENTGYNLEIPVTCTSVNITPTASDSSSSIMINDTVLNSGDQFTLPITGDTAAASIKVTAADNTSKTYNIAVTKTDISHNANLASLEVSEGILSPAFNLNTLNYSINVGHSTKVNVSAIPAGISATYQIIGDSGADLIKVVVTAQDTTTTKTYTIVVNREPADNNANLVDLTLATGTLSPSFTQDSILYFAHVENSIESITVRPTASSSKSLVKVNNQIVETGASSETINLMIGQNTITVEVTAEDEITVKTYTVMVTRLSETGHNSDLASLSLSHGELTPVFNTSELHYTVEVAKSLSTVTVTPLVFGPSSTVTINGTSVMSGTASQDINLNPVSTLITIVVTAEDNSSTTTYNITVTRSIVSHNANLSGMTLSSGTLSPEFDLGVFQYSVTTPVDVVSIKITPITSFTGAAVKVNNVTVVSGTPSQAIDLKSGIVVPVTVVVTAEDGVSTKTYTVNIKRLEINLIPSLTGDTGLSGEWASIAMSSDGTKLAAVAGWIYTSSDGGVTWIERTTAGWNNWASIASSSDGVKLAAAGGNSIYTSGDGGVTWIERTTIGYGGWNSITSSSDGTKLIAADDAYVYKSIDSGITWTRTTAGYKQWKAIVSSSDGIKIAAAPLDGYIFTSIDGGVTWLQRTSAGSRKWNSIASSADGTKIAAVVNGGYIYTSTDGGETWTSRKSDSSRNWKSITSSSDGLKIAAVMNYYDGFTNTSYIYTSVDGGMNWISKYSNGVYLRSIISSSDGSKLVTTDWHGYIYTSADSGATWIERQTAGVRYWTSITSSSDGAKLAAAALSGYIYTSTDGGATWIERTSAGCRNWKSVTSSLDGLRLAAAAVGDYPNGNYIYTSTDGGITWIERTSAGYRNWKCITTSSDGSKLAASAMDGYIYTSIDGGVTWIERKPAGSNTNVGWDSITSSSDGLKLAATDEIGCYIYTSTDGGETWIKRTSAGLRGWTGIMSSSDGTTLIAFEGYVNLGYIYTSTDGGVTWLERTAAGKRKWMSVVSSSDGTKLGAVDQFGYIYTSIDGGFTWIEHISLYASWQAITMASDGSSFAAVCQSRYIFICR